MGAVREPRAFEQRCACLAALGRAADLELLLERPSATERAAVRYYLALAYARNGEIGRAAEQVRIALQQTPDYPGLRELASRIEPAVAMAFVEAGDRRAAVEIWTRGLESHPDDFALLRNLAILYYWWARAEEEAGGPEVDRLWMATIAYTTQIAASDAFWSAWREELSRRWGVEALDSDLQPLRDTLVEQRLMRVFESFAASYKEQGRAVDAERHDDYLTLTLLARRPAQPAPIELGKILVLIEDRGMADKALARLAALPENVRQTPDARYLRVRALVESARALSAQRLSAEALRRIEAAWVDAQALEPRWAPLQAETRELLDSLATQEAARLEQEKRADEAIDLPEGLYRTTLENVASVARHRGQVSSE